MLTEYIHEHARELRELEQSRPRYERIDVRRGSRLRDALRAFALAPEKAIPGAGGAVPRVVIRPAGTGDGNTLARLAEASERRLPQGLVLVAEIDSQVVAALPMEGRYVLSDLFRPTADVLQLLELRSKQLRAARLDEVA